MDDHRPDPDALLAAVQKDEARQSRGKLKIFLGMAAGVGKTYAMLEYAHQRKNEGVDVVVGYIETHKRAETEALTRDLEVVPRRVIEYRGAALEEMDIDAILARQPELVLVDELAHTNVEGSRHAKRYFDVIELLDAGIDVWTTVNVQHFESRADSVQQITGIKVHETVPDSLLDLASEIELIDLSPDDLRKRLREGKVYTAERIELAADNFFRIGNLTALREMALRLTAERVDHQLQDYMQLKRIAGPWKSGERLMVAISPSPFSEKLIRWTRRMAYNLEAPWLAVYIETSQTLPPEAKEQLTRNIDLARGLGAEIVTTAGDDITSALIRLARQRNATQIIIGKPQHSRLQIFLRGGSLVDRIIRSSGEIDVYVVTGDDTDDKDAGSAWRLLPQPKTHSSFNQYVLALVIVAVVTIIDILVTQSFPWIGHQAVGLTELLAVLLIAVYIGRGPALLAALVSAFSWNFLFIEPRFTFEITQLQDIILFMLYFIIAIFAGNLTARIRTQERQARYNADRTMALYTLAHETATAVSMDDVLRTAVDQISRVFNAEVAFLLTENGKLARNRHPSGTLTIDEKEYSVAIWAFENGRPAGHFTDTLPLASAQFLPLLTPNRTVGVIGIRMREEQRLSFHEEVLLETFVNQVALVIEREQLDEAAEQSAMLRESERLYTTLLNSISHELRTPIAAIMGAASSLLDPAASASAITRRELAKNVHDSADRLNRLVENLLDMSRLESGRLRLKLDWCDVGDMVGVAVSRFERCFAERSLSLNIPSELPLIQADFVLVEQVLANLLDNVCNYTPVGTHVEIAARTLNNDMEITIADNGKGIPSEELERIFEKFYRVPGTATGGTGLGLSISRGLIEAHNGTLTAENRSGGGTRFIIRLPMTGTPPPVREAAL
jgi:two-component system sensor histidine kinase KdpD